MQIDQFPKSVSIVTSTKLVDAANSSRAPSPGCQGRHVPRLAATPPVDIPHTGLPDISRFTDRHRRRCISGDHRVGVDGAHANIIRFEVCVII